ncbi:MAG: SCP-like extracellular [Solirubrobacterales bacterium]|nr:SCP-like extracellular [Solirubrobacterales bacterium]
MAPLRTLGIAALGTLALAASAAVAPALGATSNPHRGAVCASYHAGGGLPGSCNKRTRPRSGHRTCANTRLRPTPANIALIRAATLCLINRERAAHGERALRPNKRLRRAAQAHSASMALGDYFEHDGPSGQTPLARLRNAGYISSSRVGYEVGENIAWGTLYLATPHAIVASWMASPGHRANILDARYRETGIGVSPHPPASLAHGQAGAIYTQDFGVIIAG